MALLITHMPRASPAAVKPPTLQLLFSPLFFFSNFGHHRFHFSRYLIFFSRHLFLLFVSFSLLFLLLINQSSSLLSIQQDTNITRFVCTGCSKNPVSCNRSPRTPPIALGLFLSTLTLTLTNWRWRLGVRCVEIFGYIRWRRGDFEHRRWCIRLRVEVHIMIAVRICYDDLNRLLSWWQADFVSCCDWLCFCKMSFFDVVLIWFSLVFFGYSFDAGFTLYGICFCVFLLLSYSLGLVCLALSMYHIRIGKTWMWAHFFWDVDMARNRGCC